MSAINQVEEIMLTHMDEFPTDFGYDPYHYGSMLTEAIEEVSKFPEQATIYDILDSYELRESSSARVYTDYVATLVKHRLNVAELASSSANLLNPPAEDADWQARYKHVMALFMAEHGTVMKLADGYFGWEDYDFLEKNRHPVVAAIVSVREDYWDEFEGTFADEVSSPHTGVIAYAVLTDGTNRPLRWEGDMSHLLKGITE